METSTSSKDQRLKSFTASDSSFTTAVAIRAAYERVEKSKEGETERESRSGYRVSHENPSERFSSHDDYIYSREGGMDRPLMGSVSLQT